MKKMLSLLLALCMALALGVTAFADVAPPVSFSVTVGDKPIPRYTMEYQDNEPSSLVQAGTFYSHQNIPVSYVTVINGEKYGVYTTWNNVNAPITNEYGVRLNKWISYYFLLEDVLSPQEAATARTNGDGYTLPVVTQTQTTTATTSTQPSTTQTSTAEEAPTTVAPTQTQSETQLQTETETDTQIQTPWQTDPTAAEETTEAVGTAAAQGRSVMQTVLVCIAAAGVLALTAAVTLTLLRRKKAEKANEDK